MVSELPVYVTQLSTVTFPAGAFCANALLKSISDITVGGTIKLSIRAKTPIKIS
jgi:hypothetical protein